MVNFIIAIFLFIFVIAIVIGVHELGHFLVARWLGVKVLRFSLGFGKSLFSLKDSRGTEYVIAAIPVGGYVKLLDTREDTVAASERHLAFDCQSISKRALILAAGVFCNLLFALIIYWAVFMIGTTIVIPMIGKVVPNSIAATAGLKANQEIVSIDQEKTPTWEAVMLATFFRIGDKGEMQITTKKVAEQKLNYHKLNLANWQIDELKPNPLQSLGIIPYPVNVPIIVDKPIKATSPDVKKHLREGDHILAVDNVAMQNWWQFFKYIHEHPEQKLNFVVERHGDKISIPINIGYKRNLLLQKKGHIGITSAFKIPQKFQRKISYGFFAAFNQALVTVKNYTLLNFIVLGKLIIGKVSILSLAGPLTIFTSASLAFQLGLVAFLSFLAFISLSIGVINILPIPGLDGGQLCFLMVELFRRKPIPLSVQVLAYRLGLIIVVLIMFQAVFNDVLRLTG
jgi:regulator of sigma E protease